MKTVIILILWIIIVLLGATTTQSHNFGMFIFCAIFTVILSILLLGAFFEMLGKAFAPKKRYREVNSEEKEEYFRDNATEHITLNHPDYIGFLTKVDKKRIAEEYLESLKKENEDGKNK